MVHATRATLNDESIPMDSLWCLQVDLDNGFNRGSRAHIFREVRRLFPDLSPWVESCYGTQSVLNFGDSTIFSSTGAQQGDPLGPLLFSLLLHPVVTQLQEVEGIIQNSWYLDDGLLIGTREALTAAWDLMVREGEPRGLYLSRDKSLVFCHNYDPTDLDPLGRGVTRDQVGGCKLLGAPIGDEEFVEEVLEERLVAIQKLLDLLPTLEDPHMEYTLLRYCFSFPKIAFALRSVDTTNHQDLLKRFDEAVRTALEGILGSPLTHAQWLQASLPISQGGLGLRLASNHASAAYLSSVSAASPLVQEIRQRQDREDLQDDHISLPSTTPPSLRAAMQELQTHLGDPLTYEEVASSSQKSLSYLVDANSAACLLEETVDVREVARLKCVAREGAGDWLCALPCKSLGLHLRRSEFVAAARYRLGLQVFSLEGECPMSKCRMISDRLGDHAISCGIGGERIARHNHCRDALFQAAQQAGLGPSKEPDGLLPGSDDRPADLLIPFWTSGQDTAIDFTVVNPLQAALVVKTAEEGGSAVAHAHNIKLRKYGVRCAAEAITFIPLAVDTLGGWHPTALEIISKLGRQLARNVGKEDQEVVRHLRQRLAILLVRDNVAMMCSRTPTYPSPEVDGDDE